MSFPVEERPTGRTLEPVAADPRPEVHPADAAGADAAKWAWVPIRSLGPRHREQISAHLLALEQQDRYLRFGYVATDAQIHKYVDLLDFEHDEVFGIFNRRLQLIAMAHLAYQPAMPDGNTPTAAMAEFGVSVLGKARGRGFGARLFEHAVLHARNRGVQTLLIHALSENVAMLKIARKAGATVERDGSETAAWLRLPPDDFASHLEAMMGEHAAEVDYQLKLHATQIARFFDALAEVKTHIGNSGKIAGQ